MQSKKSINEKELEILKFWQDNNIFQKSVENPAGKRLDINKGKEYADDNEKIKSFSFYDGPPFATGIPHHGHVLAGTIKDAIPRYQTMQGKRVRRVWGWDCHGLPIENMIEKELGLNSKKDIEAYGIDKFNQAAADSVLRYEKEWKQIIPRLGRWVDMDHAYKTMDATYTESVWWSWKTLYDKGLAYEGHKIMHICPRCETPLAQSEVGLEYHDVTDMTVTVEFKLKNKTYNGNPLYILAWTTTPWTLPGNTALAVNKELEYVIVESKFENEINYFIVAKKLVEKVFAKSESYQVIEEIKIDNYIGESYESPFQTFNNENFLNTLENRGNIWKVWHADFITDESGTGIAHEAPAFGAEDMELAKANNIPVIKHVLMNGHFVNEVEESAPTLKWLFVKKKDDSISTDIEIVKLLAHDGKLFSKEKIVHSYPLCWRCKTPLLNYATSSWFVDVPKIKDKLIEENSKVKWIPEHIRDGRFGKWLEGAREWAVSRRRYWGAPLPIWKSESGKVKVIGSLAELAELNANKSKNKYIVMRHGECASNVGHFSDVLGKVKNPLTDKGVEQVSEASKHLKHITKIYTSNFERAIQTANVIAESIGLDKSNIIIDENFRETNHGGDGGKVDPVILNKELHHTRLDYRFPGGESYLDVKNRCMKSILKIEGENNGESILIVSHGSPVWLMKAGMENMTDEEAYKFAEENTTSPSSYFIENAMMLHVDLKMLPRDETGAINLHRPYIDEIKLEIEGEEYTRIPDVFDCWYESGSMPYAQIHYPFENKEIFERNFPADFIAEGMDQTRGWFYSLINLGVGLFGISPFKSVIVNGVVMAGDGRKMSKSEKNFTDPMILVERYGADALRLALASSPVMQGENIVFSDELVNEAYKKNVMKLENILNMYLLNPYDGYKYIINEDKTRNIKDNSKLETVNSDNDLDIYILARLKQTIYQVTTAFDNYKLDEATRPLEYFIDKLSIEYVKNSRYRLKGLAGIKEEEQATATLRYALMELAKLLAPMAPFLAERVYKEVDGEKEFDGKKESVHLESWPQTTELSKEELNIVVKMTKTFDTISLILNERNKVAIPVRQPLSSVALYNVQESDIDISLIKEMTNIKSIVTHNESRGVDIELGANSANDIENNKLSAWLDINITPELRREGDQRELSRAIKDMRRHMGLIASDNIVLIINKQRAVLVDDEYKKIMKIARVEIDKRQEINLSIEKA